MGAEDKADVQPVPPLLVSDGMHRLLTPYVLVALVACAVGAPAPAVDLQGAERRIVELDSTLDGAPAGHPAVITVADSLLDALERAPTDPDDLATARHMHSIVTRVRALRSQARLLSGDGLSLAEAQALNDAEPVPTAGAVAAVQASAPVAAVELDAPPTIQAVPVHSAGLIIPVVDVKPGDLQDTYNDSRSAGRVHNAIDIMAPRGTPVVAATDGQIVKLFLSERGGITVYQRSVDERTIYYYAHLERYASGLGDGVLVRQGTVLGFVGNTGNAGPANYHLHFAIWHPKESARYWDGTPVNPYPLLRPAR